MPEAIREQIGLLRMQGRTIDEILEALKAVKIATPSRSALGRHIQGLDRLGEKLRKSRQMAEALAREMGNAPESRTAQVGIEMVHTAILDLFLAGAEGGGPDADKAGMAALAGNPDGLMKLAKALRDLTGASKANVDFVTAAEKRAEDRARKAAAASVDTVGRERGIGKETLEAIKAGIFGIKTA
jgi:hypothetical protein